MLLKKQWLPDAPGLDPVTILVLFVEGETALVVHHEAVLVSISIDSAILFLAVLVEYLTGLDELMGLLPRVLSSLTAHHHIRFAQPEQQRQSRGRVPWFQNKGRCAWSCLKAARSEL